MDMKKVLIILAVSVGLNCFFVGYETSRLMNPPAPLYPERQPFPFRPDARHGKDGFHQKHAFKHDFFKLNDAQKKAMKERGKQIEASKKEVGEIVGAENFDEARLRDALNKASDLRREIDAQMQETFLENVKAMTPEQRKEFVETMKNMMAGKPRGDRKGHRFDRDGRDGRRPDFPPEDAPEMVPEMMPEPRPLPMRPDAAENREGYRDYDVPAAGPVTVIETRTFEIPAADNADKQERSLKDAAAERDAFNAAREERRMMKRKLREERRRQRERESIEERKMYEEAGNDKVENQ